MQRSRQFEGDVPTEPDGPSPHRRVGIATLIGRIVVAQLLIGILAAIVVSRLDNHAAAVPAALSAARRQVTVGRTPAKAIRPSLGTRSPRYPSTTIAPATTVPVAPAGLRRDPSAIVTLPSAVTGAQLKAVSGLPGVESVEVVDIGTVGFLGAPALTVGVDPGTFRDYTPAATATADQLWQYIAQGTLASSFEMSRDRKLGLGVMIPVVAAGSGATSRHWLGAFMSVGLPGIDLVASRRLSASLGLSPWAGLIVSAPTADPFVLQSSIKAAAAGASVVLMRPGLMLGSTPPAGEAVVSPAQLSTALTAAISRVGKPYVWGGTGPSGFDCSGLVGWSFAAAGIGLPRTAAAQALAGPAVPLNQLQPGDLLFWAYDPADPGFIDHVAIYLGRGQMIEAPQTGAMVHIIALQTGHLVGAVRVNPAISARLGSPWRG